MSELRALLADTTMKVLSTLPDDDAAAWKAVTDAGLANVMVPEADDGFGGGWEDAFIVLRATGLHATPIALAEAVAEPALKGASAETRFNLMALTRACQMAGAMQAALDLSVQYTRERQQFGKPLSTFQAIQQQLALFAEETAATNMAAIAACRAADRGDAVFEIASAKLRANIAVSTITSVAHQVHGAMGFTSEYGLHHFTRRLWEWRSEYGNDRYWADKLGTLVAAKGATGFWPALVNPATIGA
jgi:alkylation response protein AidB-like acyl-CoA dehydrogenase